jgi:membrane protein implicated in regulation of membrane protease activity
MESITPELIWVLLGISLILAEFVLPGLIAIFFGLGALAVGLLLWAGMSGEGALPFVVFSGVSVGSLLLLRGLFKPWFTGRSLGVQVTGEDDDFVGHKAEVASGFDESRGSAGRIIYRGTQWDARAADGCALEIGSQVQIVDREGSVLIIDKD